LDRALGIDPRLGDAMVDAANETRIRQHRTVRIDQVADLLGGGFGQARRLDFELTQLAQRNCNRLGETATLELDLALREMALADRDIAPLSDVRGADGNAGRYREARQPALNT